MRERDDRDKRERERICIEIYMITRRNAPLDSERTQMLSHLLVALWHYGIEGEWGGAKEGWWQTRGRRCPIWAWDGLPMTPFTLSGYSYSEPVRQLASQSDNEQVS